MTMLYELDLIILKLYVHKNERLGQGFRKLSYYKRHTDAQTDATKHTTSIAVFAGEKDVLVT